MSSPNQDATQRISRHRYRNKPIDPSIPSLSASTLLSIPSSRPGRRTRSTPLDMNVHQHYGDAVIQKGQSTTRLFFQNVNGLTYTSTMEDYRYYMSCLQAYDVDIVGLSETNTCWSHPHLTADFQAAIRSFHKQSKVCFGSPSTSVDPCPTKEHHQAGGNVTLVTGPMTSRIHGSAIQDSSGLGRWCGYTLLGKHDQKLTVITAYRVCHGSPSSVPLGSSFLREYEYLRSQKHAKPNPRRQFLLDLQTLVLQLQGLGHAIVVMLDANATLTSDNHFLEFIDTCGLHDLHSADPAPSTYIGSVDRRIDFMFGCDQILNHLSRSGTLAYSEGPQSDHRGLYVDLALSFLQRPSWDTVTPTKSRALHTGNPELVEKYHSSMLEYYESHNMLARIEELEKCHRTMSRDLLRDELIKWDNDQGRAMEHSERSLRFPTKKCDWSPQLRDSAIIRRYWSLRLREVTRNENYHATFLRWQDRIRIHQPTFSFAHLDEALTTEQVREQFNRSNRHFRKCQRQATSLRQQTYYDLLASYEDDYNPNTKTNSLRKARIVRNTISGECTRSKFANIRRVVKPTVTSALTKVLIPAASEQFNSESDSVYHHLQSNTEHDSMLWETIVDRSEIERHILNYNRESFKAASSSPCGHGVIYDAITFTSLSPASEKLLRGEIPSDWDMDDLQLRAFLASFAIPEHVQDQPPITTTITEEEVKQCFKSWKEATSTSPSGRHLGHYKAIIGHPLLLRCFVKFMNIVIERGIAIPRWCNATNVMIEKDSGRPRINRLRIVHLFEADLNFFLRLQWGHRLVRHAIKLDLLHNSQHGSIPGRAAMDPIMLTQLTSDLCRILKHDLFRFDNDASACYDRIIVALGMLAARRCGMPKNAIRLHAEALQFMKYTVKTVYGISEENYVGTIFEPLFGTGQGSGASPAVWLTLVVLLLHTLDRLIPDRMNFSAPSGRTHSRLADAFVDDTSVGFTSSDSTQYEELVKRLEHIAQTWEHLLSLSGGQLNLKKCSWFAMRWEWKSGRPTLREIQSTDPSLRLHSGQDTSETVPIRQTELDSSSRMLGVMLNPMGNFSAHISELRKRADDYSRRLLSPRLNASDASIFHQCIYIPSMRYSLAAMAVDEQDLSCIQSRIMQSLLQKLGYSSKIPTALRHGPTELGGLGLYDLRTEAGLEALKFFRNSIYENSETGNLLRINLEHSQREAGILEPLLAHPNIYVSYLTPSWLMSLRQYLFLHNLHIVVTDTFQDTLRGPSDAMIMQQEHLGRYTEAQQRDLNLVRMYLQVSKLSDMVDRDQPNRIALCFLDAARPSTFVTDDNWPRQEQPSASSQHRLWKRYLVSSYLRYIP